MAWLRTRRLDTRQLLHAEHRPHVPRGYAGLVWGALLVAILASGFAGWYWMRQGDQHQAQQRIAELEARNQELTEALERERLQVNEEKANRDQLMRRIDAMSAQIKQLKTEQAFYRQQKPGK
ncbi:hypothetical protein [Pseudomonas sp. PDNC002]|uniref:hypothetical protein n=1 Tax=Pseudomonas sp. PDNC002 TaxID=2811422 RepID=UPI001F06681E|nr:hypothetical protein [Pseudomonas sp. PDNC002]